MKYVIYERIRKATDKQREAFIISQELKNADVEIQATASLYIINALNLFR